MNKLWRFFSIKQALFASRLTLAYILLRSAIPHLENPYQFAQSVADYQILSGFFVSMVAIAIPIVEVVVAIALLFVGAWWGCAARAACVLSVVFLAVQLQALARGLDISCGCFGSEVEDRIGVSSLLQAAALGICGGMCLFSLLRLGAINEIHEC